MFSILRTQKSLSFTISTKRLFSDFKKDGILRGDTKRLKEAEEEIRDLQKKYSPNIKGFKVQNSRPGPILGRMSYSFLNLSTKGSL